MPAKMKHIPNAKQNPVRQVIFRGRNDTQVNVVTYDGIVVDAYQTSSASEPFRVGDTIRHITLGKGRVLGYAAPGELRVQFEIGGEKTLLLRFQADKISKELP